MCFLTFWSAWQQGPSFSTRAWQTPGPTCSGSFKCMQQSFAMAGSSSFISKYKIRDRIRIKILGSQTTSHQCGKYMIHSSFGIQVTHLELHCSTPCTDRSRMSPWFGYCEGILSTKSEHRGTYWCSFLVTFSRACKNKTSESQFINV